MRIEQKYRNSIQYDSVLSAWREQFAQAIQDPALKQQLANHEQTLLPRFTAQYNELRSQPRRVRREMQRKWKRSLAGMALLLALGQTSALAATYSIADGDVAGLIAAINAANANSNFDTIQLAANSTFTLTAVNSDLSGPTGLPVVTSAITIEGDGATISRAGSAPEFRLLAVDSTGNLTLKKTKITGGRLSGADARGGGLFNYTGDLTLIDSTVSGNAVPGEDGRGGGIGTRSTTEQVSLTLINSTIVNNTAGNIGGGIAFQSFGKLTVDKSTISGNSAGDGGGLLHLGDNSEISNTTISGNSASAEGGTGGMLQGGTLTLTNTTVSNNSAAGMYGVGGIGSFIGGTLTVTNSTITGNSAPNGVGGLAGSTIVLNRTLVSGNQGPLAAELFLYEGASVDASNFNVFGHSGLTNAQAFSTNFVPSGGDITATSDGTTPTSLSAILSTSLAANGGPTKTHALVSGSPAVNAVGSGCPPPSTDQRGTKRPQGAACDVGSYELKGGGGGGPPPDGRCAGKVVTLMGTALRDNLTGTKSADVIQGLGGNDTLAGLGGSDTICGGPGNDSANGGPGNDQMFGDGGNDRLSGADGSDRLNGGSGRDNCNGGSPRRGDRATSCEAVSNVP